MGKSNIKNVKDKIEGLILDLGLEVEESIDEALEHPFKRYYYTKCKDKNGRQLFFKVRIKDDEETKNFFDREIWFSKFVDKYGSKGLLERVKKYLDSGDDVLQWLLTEYVDGKVMGEKYILDYIYLKENDIDELIILLRELQKLRLEGAEKMTGLLRFDYDYYKKLNEQETIHIIDNGNLIEKKFLIKLEKLIDDYKEVFDKDCKFLAHGDFQGPNLLKTRENILVFDFEQVHVDNRVYDVAYLWEHCWREERFRDELLKSFLSLQDSEFKVLFMIVAMILMKVQIWSCYKFIHNKSVPFRTKRNIKDRQEALKIHLKKFEEFIRE